MLTTTRMAAPLLQIEQAAKAADVGFEAMTNIMEASKDQTFLVQFLIGTIILLLLGFGAFLTLYILSIRNRAEKAENNLQETEKRLEQEERLTQKLLDNDKK